MTGFPGGLPDLMTALGKRGVRVPFAKAIPPTGIAGVISSHWLSAGSTSFPAGSAPGSTAMVAPNRSTTGALQFPLASGVGRSRFLGRATFGGSSAAHSWEIHDRLLHCDGISGTATSTVTIGGASAPARGLFDVHHMFLEWYGATGATPFNATVTYVNQDGNTRTTPSVAVPASVGIGRVIGVPLFAGDWQVQTVTSYTPDASSGSTAGSAIGITVSRLIAFTVCDRAIPRPVPLDALILGLPQVPDDSCLSLLLGFGASATSPSCGGSLWFPEGES